MQVANKENPESAGGERGGVGGEKGEYRGGGGVNGAAGGAQGKCEKRKHIKVQVGNKESASSE